MKQAKAKVVENTEELRVELSVVCGAESGLFTITETGLEISEDISFDQFKQILRVLKLAKYKSTIWLADAIAFGNRIFGTAVVEDALEQLEFDMPVVRAAITVGSIPEELRYANLDSDHYVVLAGAEDPKEQIKWARIASEKHLNPSQLKFSMAEGEIVDRAAARQLNTGVITPHGIRQSFDVWLRRMGGLEGIKKLELDMQEEIVEELSAIVEFGLAMDAALSSHETDPIPAGA